VGSRLVDQARGGPVRIEENLDIQEIDVLEEIQQNWGEVHAYVAVLIAGAGIEEVLADELAVIPGMEEASCLLYINKYYHASTYDCLILDCAPTAESLRFISFPSILRWYMSRLFTVERNLVRVARPLLKHIIDVPLPPEEYFDNLKELFSRMDGVDDILTDHRNTTVRLVTNPEKMVVAETQRAFMYFSLYGLLVDGLIVNRILPRNIDDQFFKSWLESQSLMIDQIETLFPHVPIFKVPLSENEVFGTEALARIGATLYEGRNPKSAFIKTKPFTFRKRGKTYALTMSLPFIDPEDLEVARVDDQLIIRVGGWKRYIALPRGVPAEAQVDASLAADQLTVKFIPQKT